MILATMLLTAAAPTATPDQAADARCAYLLGFVGSRGTAETATRASAGILYYIGKIRGRDADFDVDAAIRTARAAAKQAGIDPRAELTRCISELRTTDSISQALKTQSPNSARDPSL